jgi:hypothetical protein
MKPSLKSNVAHSQTVSISIGVGKQNIALSHLSKKRQEIPMKVAPSEISLKHQRLKYSNLRTVDKRDRQNDDHSMIDKFSQIIGTQKPDVNKTMNTQASVRDLSDIRGSMKVLAPLTSSVVVLPNEANPVEQDMVEQDLKL